MGGLLSDFKAFVLRGNVLELAVAVIMGLAFNAVVQSFVDDVLMNLIAALFGQPDFSNLTWTVGEGEIRYGAFLNAVVNFLLVALALFLIVKAFERARRLRGERTEPPEVKRCAYCTTSIPAKARRCPACTSDLETA